MDIKDKILSVFKEGKMSNNLYRSTEVPFYSQDSNRVIELGEEQDEIFKEIPLTLNHNITQLYTLLNQPYREIYIGEWTIMSLSQSLEWYKDYCSKGQTSVFNIGYKYLGMGHVIALACDLNTHRLFYRKDGGANGYDRLDRYNEVIDKGSADYPQYFFSEWFNTI